MSTLFVCFCFVFAPCIIQRPPSFFVGSSAPYPRNRQHRFRLYRGFWKTLKDLGLWTNPRYLDIKRRRTVETDPREVLPTCVVRVSNCKKSETENIHNYMYYCLSRKSGGDTPISQESLTLSIIRPSLP